MKVEFDNLTRVIDLKKQSIGTLRRKLLECVVVESGALVIDPACMSEAENIQADINRVKNEIRRGEDYIALCKQLIKEHNIPCDGVKPYEEGEVNFDKLIQAEKEIITANTAIIKAQFMDGKLTEKEFKKLVQEVAEVNEFRIMEIRDIVKELESF